MQGSVLWEDRWIPVQLWGRHGAQQSTSKETFLGKRMWELDFGGRRSLSELGRAPGLGRACVKAQRPAAEAGRLRALEPVGLLGDPGKVSQFPIHIMNGSNNATLGKVLFL